MIGDTDLAESHPGAQAAEEPIGLRKAVERIHDSTVHQREVAGIERNRHVRSRAKQPVEGAIRDLQEAVGVAFDAAPIDDVVSLHPFLVEGLDQLGGILEIAIEEHDRIAAADAHTAGESTLRAEVATVGHGGHMRIAPYEIGEHLSSIVGTGVIDEDDFVIDVELCEDGDQTLVHNRDCRSVAIARDDCADLPPAHWRIGHLAHDRAEHGHGAILGDLPGARGIGTL